MIVSSWLTVISPPLVHWDYFLQLLVNPELLEHGLIVDVGHPTGRMDIAVPVGGARRCGNIYVWDERCIGGIFDRLVDRPRGFPNPRTHRRNANDSHGLYIDWGESEPEHNPEVGLAYGYKPELVEAFMARMAARQNGLRE